MQILFPVLLIGSCQLNDKCLSVLASVLMYGSCPKPRDEDTW